MKSPVLSSSRESTPTLNSPDPDASGGLNNRDVRVANSTSSTPCFSETTSFEFHDMHVRDHLAPQVDEVPVMSKHDRLSGLPHLGGQ